MLAYASRALGDFHEAQDVTQESFLSLYSSARTYSPRGRFGAYLFRIAGNAVRSRYRKKRPVTAEENMELASDGNEEGNCILHADLESSLNDLPEGQREALLLVSLGGLSYREVADIMEISRDAVAQRVLRARRNLRARLWPEEGKDR